VNSDVLISDFVSLPVIHATEHGLAASKVKSTITDEPRFAVLHNTCRIRRSAGTTGRGFGLVNLKNGETKFLSVDRNAYSAATLA